MLLYMEIIHSDGVITIPSDIQGGVIIKVTNGKVVYSGSLNL